MWHWLNQHAQLLNTFLNLGMLLIWGIYLQLLLNNFLRQRNAKLIINRGKGRGINALCIISNMSQEPIFVEAIIGVLETSEDTYTYDITDFTDESQDAHGRGGQESGSSELRQVTRQGPMSQGQYVQIGSYRQLIKGVAEHHGIEIDGHCFPKADMVFKSFELRLIALYGPEDNPVGAQRRFNIEQDDNGDYILMPAMPRTQQLKSRRERREIERWLEDVM